MHACNPRGWYYFVSVKGFPEKPDLYYDMCGGTLCEECEIVRLCSTFVELRESETDLEDVEAEEA